MSVRPSRLARSVPRAGTGLGKNARPKTTSGFLEPITPDLFRAIRGKGGQTGRAELRRRRRAGESARSQREARQQLKAMYR